MGLSTLVQRAGVTFAVVVSMLALTVSAAWASPTFSKLPAEMFKGRYAPIAASLPNGEVLVAGGYNESSKFMKSAELFDPATSTFKMLTGEMSAARDEFASATLADGKVLLVGGYNGKTLKSGELFDPATGTFEALSSTMSFERDGPAAARLPDGRVLIVGGVREGGEYLTTADLYNPVTRSFETLSAAAVTGRYEPTATTLPNGKVLIAGGEGKGSKSLKSTELFDPATGTFEAGAHELNEARREAASAALQNGEVLILGGYEGKKDMKTGELFDPETSAFETLSTGLTEPRTGPAAATLPNGRVLVVGGYDETLPEVSARDLKTAEESSVSAPTATTTAAAGVGANGATLGGTVLTEAAATAYFQYGTSTAYGTATPGQSVGGSRVAHSLAAAVSGLAPATTYHFRMVAENAGGPSYGVDQTFTTAPGAPTVTGATQTHRSWREGSALATLSRRHARAPLGTKFSFTLNEQASVSFAFTQPGSGRKVGHRCLAQTKANRHKHRCTRTLTRGTLSLTGHAGVNTLSFQGRLSHSRRLRPGTYTLVILATNTAGQRSTPVRLTFTIVK